MCTLSWRGDGLRLLVLMNRDEARSRPRAEPPAEGEARGVRTLAPRDPRGGGTWILANDRGVILALSNLRGADPPAARSRGLVLLALADAATPEEAVSRWEALDLSSTRPHLFHALAPGAACAGEWTGRRKSRLAREPSAGFASTSSYDPDRIPSLRLARWVPEADLETLHRSHEGGPSAESICMHREDAATLSLSRIEVDADAVSFSYADGPPCQTPLAPARALPRA